MIRSLFLASCFTALTVSFTAPAPAVAQPAPEAAEFFPAETPASNVPLVIVRFNQDKVLFERQLYNAIAKAVAIKPDVVLDVVSFVPATGKENLDEKLSADAQTQTATVVNSLRRMGIPQERMRVSKEASDGLRYHEVHVYVE